MTDVRMPNGDVVRFPDDMSREQMTSIIHQKFPDLVPPSRLTRIGNALKAADAAGNVDDARRLAQAYKQEQAMQAQSASGLPEGAITITIEGKPVQVDRSFLSMSPEQQNQAVDEIASQIGVTPSAAPDLARIKSNVAKMVAQNAPEADIDGYIASEGVTVDDVRNFPMSAAGSGSMRKFKLADANTGKSYLITAPDQQAAHAAYQAMQDGRRGLANFRTQHPEYNDLNDQQLADALYRKFYSDMPRADFNRRLGTLNTLAGAPSLTGGGAGPDAGIGMNIGAGINDVINTTLGAPVDLSRTMINAATQPNEIAANLPMVGPLFRATQTVSQMANVPAIPDNSVGGRKWIAETLVRAGVRDPDTVNAQTEIEKILRATVSGAAYAIAPEAMLGLLSRARIVGPQATRIMEQVLGKAQNARQAAGNAVAGGLSGAGAQIGTDAAPDNLKPLMSTLGGFVGAGVGTGITGLPRLGASAGRMAGDYLAPITQTGRERLVGRQLNEAAASPGGAIEAMSTPSVMVPGSKPTTGQLSGDMGLLSLERGMQTRDPVPFQQRRADQNSARLSSLENLQATGAPEQVIGAVRSYLSDIDAQLTYSLDSAGAGARRATASLGAGRSPEVAGADLRAGFEAARADAKARERALWQAVDPNGTLVLPATATRSQANEITRSIPTTAKPASPEEAAIFRAASGLTLNARFSDITALQSRIKAEMRAERFANGESPAYRRLTQLNGAVQQDLEGAIAQKVAQEQQAVAAGRMRADDTIAAKLQGEVRAFLDARKAATGEISGTGAGGVGGSGPASVPRPYGAEIPSSRGSGNAPRYPGLPSDAGGVPFDQGALDRLTAARTATRERVETFDNKTLGPMRRRPSTTAPYDMPDAGVAQRLFYPGPKSYEAIQAYRHAVGDARAIPALTDYAVDRLRTSALGDDGILSPTKLAAWRRSHADALRALPHLDTQLDSVEAATNLMADAAKARADVLEAAQVGAVGKLIGASDPQEVTRIIGSIFNRSDASAQMLRLRSVVGSNAAARAGLRKAVVDYLLDRFVSNAEAATSGLGTIKSDQFQTFVSRNVGALRAAGFTDEEVGRLQRIAADLRQSNRSLGAVRIPGQSNTAQDVLAAKAGDGLSDTILKVLVTAAATGGGFLVGGGVGGVVAPIATTTMQMLRQNGIRKMDDLLKAALLDPEIARALMAKATPGNWKLAQISLRARFKRALAGGIAASATQSKPAPLPVAPPYRHGAIPFPSPPLLSLPLPRSVP